MLDRERLVLYWLQTLFAPCEWLFCFWTPESTFFRLNEHQMILHCARWDGQLQGLPNFQLPVFRQQQGIPANRGMLARA